MKSSIFNLLIAGGDSAVTTLLFNGRNIGTYQALLHALRIAGLSPRGDPAQARGQKSGASTGNTKAQSRRAPGALSSLPRAAAPSSGTHLGLFGGPARWWALPPDPLTPLTWPHRELGQEGGLSGEQRPTRPRVIQECCPQHSSASGRSPHGNPAATA